MPEVRYLKLLNMIPKIRINPSTFDGNPAWTLLSFAIFDLDLTQKYKLCWLHHAKTEFAGIFF